MDHMSTKNAAQLLSREEMNVSQPVARDIENMTVGDASAFVDEGLAATALALEDYRGVIKHCSKIVAVSAGHFEGWFNLGYARHKVGELEEAEFAYRQAHHINSNAAEPLINLAILHESRGDAAAARDAYQQALHLAPGNTTGLWNLALLFEKEGRLEDAELLLMELAEQCPDHQGAWFQLGSLRIVREDWEGAVAAFETSLNQNPDLPEAILNSAFACMKLGRLEEARSGFEQLLESTPDSIPALQGLATVTAETGDLDACLRLRRRLIGLNQNLPELTFNMALAFEKQGRIPEATRLYSEALKQRPKFVEALLNLGHMLEKSGQTDAAQDCWKNAVALGVRPISQ
jgi:tetratricopeptide (TPR) repeat protein